MEEIWISLGKGFFCAALMERKRAAILGAAFVLLLQQRRELKIIFKLY